MSRRAKKSDVTELVQPPKRDARLEAMSRIAAKMDGWRPARQVLKKVRAVQTIFPSFDQGTRVGGLPIDRITTIHGRSNEGKAQPLHSLVLTPSGWRQMGSLKVGDLVIGGDGVQHSINGVFPQGEKEVFRVTMNDGASTLCCAEHLWYTTTVRELRRGATIRGPRPDRERIPTGEDGEGSVKSLLEIRDSLDAIHILPIVVPVEFDECADALPLDPYLLGLLLGDGSFRGTCVTFSKPESDLQSEVARRVPDDDCVTHADAMTIRIRKRANGHDKSATLLRLNAMGLGGLLSDEKFIPSVYMMAPPPARLALLCGILDTDGSVTQHGAAVDYCSASERLARDVMELARSLGGLVTQFGRRTTRYQGGEGISWRMLISMPNGLCPVASEKNLAKWKGREKNRYRTIASIEPEGVEECMCISIDSADHLYVTDDYIVTHNTVFTLGLMLSFLQGNHFVAHVDSEMTTSITWCEKLMGGFADHPGYLAMRPSCMEEANDGVREFLTNIGAAKKNGVMPESTTGLVVIDSLRKLPPRNMLARLLKEGVDKHGADGMRGRGAQQRAAVNAQWLDELVPLLNQNGCGLVIVARETEDPDADPMARKFDTVDSVKIGGGKAVIYDASLVARIERAKWLYQGADEDKMVIGERHRVRVWKTKVGGKEDKVIDTYFHTSNGSIIPEGFDRARDVLELAREMGIVKGEGAWLRWGDRKWQGENNAVKRLTAEPDVLAELEAKVRTGFQVEGQAPEVEET
jgi:RecA/RadA recombinase